MMLNLCLITCISMNLATSQIYNKTDSLSYCNNGHTSAKQPIGAVGLRRR